MDKSTWDISYDLECILEKCFNQKFDHTGTIFDRSTIEEDMFYDDMHLLLHMYGVDGSQEFIDKYFKYKRTNMNDIPNYQEIFEEFLKLIQIK